MPAGELSYPANKNLDSGALVRTSYGASLLFDGLVGGNEAIVGCAGLDFRDVGLVGDDSLGCEDGFGLLGC